MQIFSQLLGKFSPGLWGSHRTEISGEGRAVVYGLEEDETTGSPPVLGNNPTE